MCSCSFEPKTADQYLFCCKILFDLRKDLLNSLFAMSKSLKIFSDEQLLNVLLYGSEKFIFSANTKILRPAIKFLKTECLECLLFQTQLSVDIFARVTIFFYFLFPVFVSFCDFSQCICTQVFHQCLCMSLDDFSQFNVQISFPIDSNTEYRESSLKWYSNVETLVQSLVCLSSAFTVTVYHL